MDLPIVLGGGAAIGLILLFTKGKSGTANAAAQTVGANPALVSASVAMNTAALGAQVQLAAQQEQLGLASINADVSKQAQLYGYLENQSNNATMVQNTQITTNAGITNAIIASSTAIAVDQSNNAARTQQVQIGANVSIAQSNNQEKIAKLQSKGSIVSSIASSIGSVAKAALI